MTAERLPKIKLVSNRVAVFTFLFLCFKKAYFICYFMMSVFHARYFSIKGLTHCVTQNIPAIIRQADSLRNRSELGASKHSRYQAGKKACEKAGIGFGFTPNWLKKVPRDILANQKT